MPFMWNLFLRQRAANIFEDDVDSPDTEEGATIEVTTCKDTLIQQPDDCKYTFGRFVSESSTAANSTHDRCDSQDSDAGSSEGELGSWPDHDLTSEEKVIAV